MEKAHRQQTTDKNRDAERGAALVMVLLISFLLMVAGSALLFAASMNTANVTDSVAEQQAYYAAESGIQSALNILRNDRDDASDVGPTPLVDPTKSVNHSANVVDYRKASQFFVSNNPDDPSTVSRLSRWLNYNVPGNPSRVSTPGTNKTAQAFNLNVFDPDNTGEKISYTITNCKVNNTSIINSTVGFVYPNAGARDRFVITYDKPTAAQTTDLNVSTAPAAANFGSFKIQAFNAGARIPNNSNVLRAGIPFEITYKMTYPYETTRLIRGTITPINEDTGNGLINPTSVNDVKFKFESGVFELKGSLMTINNLTSSSSRDYLLTPNAPNVNGGVTPITGTVTAAEPQRLLIVSTGYGPRGAKKQLEAIVRKNFFDGLYAPATLTLVGPAAGAVYKPGNSENSSVSGDDVVSNFNLPPVGVSDQALLPTVLDEHDDKKPVLTGKPADVSGEMPDWLHNATALHKTIEDFKRVAISSGRCYNTVPVTTANPAIPGCTNATPQGLDDYGLGDFGTGTGITFINGDADYGPDIPDGGGILIVTGKLNFRGDFKFKGLILVTGAGGMDRSGGGNGELQGNIVVAPYNKNNLGDPAVAGSGFLPPKYDTSGGGTSEIRYNSSSVNNGLLAVSNVILGIAEK